MPQKRNRHIPPEKLAGYRFEAQYVGEDNWTPRPTERALEILGDSYTDVEIIVDYLRDGSSIRTPFAFYRMVRV